jgi:hypothetical protein
MPYIVNVKNAASSLASRTRPWPRGSADLREITQAIADLADCLSDLADCVSDLDSKVARLKNR